MSWLWHTQLQSSFLVIYRKQHMHDAKAWISTIRCPHAATLRTLYGAESRCDTTHPAFPFGFGFRASEQTHLQSAAHRGHNSFGPTSFIQHRMTAWVLIHNVCVAMSKPEYCMMTTIVVDRAAVGVHFRFSFSTLVCTSPVAKAA